MPDIDPDSIEDPKDLRTQLKAALKANADLSSTVQQQGGQIAVLGSGVQLSPRQQRIVLRELAEEKTELTAENIKEVAKELGFAQAPATPPAGQNGDGQQGQQQPADGQQLDPGQQPDAVDQDIMVSLNELGAIDQANYHAKRGNVSPDLQAKINQTNNSEELTALLRAEGPRSGIVHEWDTE